MYVSENSDPSIAVIHVPYGYLPDTMGGTEVYVAGLTQELQSFGVSSFVVAAGQVADYVHEGVPVKRIPVSPNLKLEALYSDGDSEAAREFGVAVDAIKPQVVHFHALTASASVAAMREAAKRRVPVVLTYHTPTVSCVRGTMLLWGRDTCDGRMIVSRCTACALHGKGLPRLLAKLAANIPLTISRAALLRTTGRMSTVLGMRWLVNIRHRTTRAAFDICSRVIAPCDWVFKVLAINGVPEAKIVLSRQGLSKPAMSSPVDALNRPNATGTLRLVFLGRIHPTKGLHTLLRALALLPGRHVSLDIYGARALHDTYADLIEALAANDSRVQIHEPIPNEQIVATIKNYDVLVVPSEWLETGPLVIYEAFAAGVPVLGTNIGGIRELVSDGRNGRLIESGDIVAWANAMAEIADNSALPNKWRENLPTVRTMRDVADDTQRIYREIASTVETASQMTEKPRRHVD